jgi:hypothetical protein|tara:strand:- start:306 stop:449 length:144 start_codon:yes stop_codon:yes gene_type:complete
LHEKNPDVFVEVETEGITAYKFVEVCGNSLPKLKEFTQSMIHRFPFS